MGFETAFSGCLVLDDEAAARKATDADNEIRAQTILASVVVNFRTSVAECLQKHSAYAKIDNVCLIASSFGFWQGQVGGKRAYSVKVVAGEAAYKGFGKVFGFHGFPSGSYCIGLRKMLPSGPNLALMSPPWTQRQCEVARRCLGSVSFGESEYGLGFWETLIRLPPALSPRRCPTCAKAGCTGLAIARPNHKTSVGGAG